MITSRALIVGSVESVFRATLSSSKKLMLRMRRKKNFIFEVYYPTLFACIARATLRAVLQLRRIQRVLYDGTRPGEIFLVKDQCLSDSTHCTLHCYLLVMCWLLVHMNAACVEDESTDIRDVYTRRSSFASSSGTSYRKLSKDLLPREKKEQRKNSKVTIVNLIRSERDFQNADS